MKLYLFALAAVIFLASAYADLEGLEKIEVASELDAKTRSLLMGDSETVGSQEVPRGSDEHEGDDSEDEEFDNQLCLKESPPALPNIEEVQKIVQSQSTNKLSSDTTGLEKSRAVDPAGFDVASYDAKVSYWKPAYWWPIWKCCPRVFNYGCRSATTRLGIFRHWFNYKREWCYPLTRIYVHRCLCSECQIRNYWCPRQGRCNRRYTRRTFLALCNRWGWGWSFLRVVRKWLPSSCYCRAK